MSRTIDISIADHLKEYLEDYGISAYKLAKETGINYASISNILNDKKNITLEISYKLGRYFNDSSDMWYRLQMYYDKMKIEDDKEKMGKIKSIIPFPQYGALEM